MIFLYNKNLTHQCMRQIVLYVGMLTTIDILWYSLVFGLFIYLFKRKMNIAINNNKQQIS